MMTSPEVDVADTADLLTPANQENECRERRRKRGGWFWVEPVLIAYCFSAFPLIIISQKYTLGWIAVNVVNDSTGRGQSPCDPNITDYERHLADRVQSLTSAFSVLESVVWGIPAVIVTIALGAGSDRVGRRVAILPPLFGAVAQSVVAYAVIRTGSSIVYFLIGDFLYGCCGTFAAVGMSCFAYIADRTPAERRMTRITLVQVCIFVAGSVSSIGLGQLIGLVGVDNVMLIVVCISAVNFAYVFLFLRNDDRKVDHQEPVAVDSRSSDVPDDEGQHLDRSGCVVNSVGSGDHRQPRFRPVQPRSDDDDLANLSHSRNPDEPPARSESEPRSERQMQTICDDVQHVVSLFLSPGRHRIQLNILIAAFFISTLPTFDMSLTTLFEMNQPLCWTVREIGVFTGVMLVVSGLGALMVTPLMKRYTTDWHIAMSAGIASVITNVYKFFVRDSLMMYLSLSLSMLEFLITPSIRSLMSALVSDREQGAVFGAIASVEVLCMMLGSVIFNSIYSKTLSIASGFVFLVMAGFYTVSCILLIAYRIRARLGSRCPQLQQPGPAAESD